jgi:phenylalanyl-tRNA synthetase beta chain
MHEIAGKTILVRDSRPGETFVTLDEKVRKLPEGTVMICDAERPVAIGGIMGGLNSEVSETTTDVLLEAAYFKRERIAESSKKLGLSTEASQRFERGADPEGLFRALDRAASLMAEIAGGRVSSGIIDVYPNKQECPEVPFRPERVNHVLGTGLKAGMMYPILERLGFHIGEKTVTAPSFRVDIHQEIDLVEEIARLIGYDQLPSRKVTEFPYERVGSNDTDRKQNLVREKLIETGFNEALTNSMIREEEAAYFFKGDLIRIVNPVSDDMAVMRPVLLPGLLKNVAFNINRNWPDLRLFEIGRVFRPSDQQEIPDQPYHVAAVISGSRNPEHWELGAEPVDFFDLKGLVETFTDKIFLDKIRFILYDNHEYLEPEKAMYILLEGRKIGYFGQLKKDVLEAFEIEIPVLNTRDYHIK